MWSLGVAFAELIFKTEEEHLFKSVKDNDYVQLLDIVELLGSKDFHAFVKKYDFTSKIKPEFEKLLPTADPIERKPWSDLVTDKNRHLVSEEAFDLLSQMLRYDYKERITPKDAMKHAYFQNLRNVGWSHHKKFEL